MSAGRDAILARIRAASATRPPTSLATPAGPAPAAPPALAAAQHVARFVERVADYRAAVRHVPPTGVGAAVDEVLAAHLARRVGAPGALPRTWRPEGVELILDDPSLSPAELDALDGVVTGSALAIAETGTIVLDASGPQGRRALTLLPDLHVCVVLTSAVVADVPQAMDAIAAAARAGRPVTMVSGPSATSDIELVRVEGVHGPRRLEVLMVDDQSELSKL